MIQLGLNKHIYIFSIIQTTRKLKFINRSYVPLLYNSSQILKNGCLGRLRLICRIFGISNVNFGTGFYQMAWLSKVAQSFSGTQSICCSPASVRQNTSIPYRLPHALRSFVRTSFQISTTSSKAQENFKDPIFTLWLKKTLKAQFCKVNRIFWRGCFLPDQQEICLPSSYQFTPGT